MLIDDSGTSSPPPRTRRTVPGRRTAAPALPYAKAFVAQFAEDTGSRLEQARGRVEHLQTGRRAPFASVAELFACMVVLLGDVEGGKEARPATHAARPR